VVLVQGASGSVGSILMRWAKALGATVVGVAGSVDKLDSVKAGGTLALHSGDPRFLERVRDLAPNGVDVVYDFVGAATFGQSVAAVRDAGTIVTIGAVSGAATPDPELLARRGIRIARGSTAQYVTSATVDRASGELFEAIRSGVFKDIVVVRYPLSEATRVHEDIAARRLGGIPILVP
jgi:NADPH2:quinone reductase